MKKEEWIRINYPKNSPNWESRLMPAKSKLILSSLMPDLSRLTMKISLKLTSSSVNKFSKEKNTSLLRIWCNWEKNSKSPSGIMSSTATTSIARPKPFLWNHSLRVSPFVCLEIKLTSTSDKLKTSSTCILMILSSASALMNSLFSSTSWTIWMNLNLRFTGLGALIMRCLKKLSVISQIITTMQRRKRLRSRKFRSKLYSTC